MHKFISSFIVIHRCCNALNRSEGTSRNSVQKFTCAESHNGKNDYSHLSSIRLICCDFVSSLDVANDGVVLAAIGLAANKEYRATMQKHSNERVPVEDQIHPEKKRPEIIRRRVKTLTMFARNTRRRHLLRTCSRNIFSLLSRQRWYSNFRPQLLHKSLSRAENAFKIQICTQRL